MKSHGIVPCWAGLHPASLGAPGGRREAPSLAAAGGGAARQRLGAAAGREGPAEAGELRCPRDPRDPRDPRRGNQVFQELQ